MAKLKPFDPFPVDVSEWEGFITCKGEDTFIVTYLVWEDRCSMKGAPPRWRVFSDKGIHHGIPHYEIQPPKEPNNE